MGVSRHHLQKQSRMLCCLGGCQVDALTLLGIPAIKFTSLDTKEASADAYRQLDNPALKLVYVTPERILKSKRFMSKLEKIHQVGMAVYMHQ